MSLCTLDDPFDIIWLSGTSSSILRLALDYRLDSPSFKELFELSCSSIHGK